MVSGNNNSMKYREASSADLPVINKILECNKLPFEDCEEHIGNFFVVEEEGKFFGLGGLQICGAIGLVRSIVVVPEYRGRGIARGIYKLIEDRARDLGIDSLYLLTDTAEEYFLKLGFSVKDRNEIPASVTKTKQFRGLCPSSANVMFREISGKGR
tara:strand:- start:376 stop:843 length:468 start_codon:yes stop_codon:yes gene_type:complete